MVSCTPVSISIKGKESRFSELLSRQLTVFCARNNLPFVFSHQFSVGLGAASGGVEDTADIAAYYYEKTMQVLLGFAEVKRVPEEKSKWQLCAYLSEAVADEGLPRASVGITIDHKVHSFGIVGGSGQLVGLGGRYSETLREDPERPGHYIGTISLDTPEG